MGESRDQEFEMFFRSEYPSVVRAIYVMTGDVGGSEDVAQEAFARAYGHWRRVSRYEMPGAWVRRVAINIAVSGLRRRLPFVPAPAVTPDPVDPDLHRAILTLPRAQRAAVVLHYFEDRPLAEVGSILGCSLNTAKVHLHRARRKLAAQLKEEDADVPR